jgi:uncharacterized protein YfaQ (DUF2300 family)
MLCNEFVILAVAFIKGWDLRLKARRIRQGAFWDRQGDVVWMGL